MKHWVRLASRFYPASWRRRYAIEFDAMLDEMDTGWKDVFDTVRGVLTMQFASWNLKTTALAFAVTGAALAAAIAFSIPSRYQSTSVMRITPARVGQGAAWAAGPAQRGAQRDASLRMNDIEQEVLSRTSLQGLITGLGLYQSQRRERPMEDIVQDMRTHDINIKPVRLPGGNSSPVAFSISTTYPDPRLAQAVNRELVTKFTEQNVVVQRGGDPRVAENLEVLDPASLPLQPIYPLRVRFAFAGLCAGLFTGLAVSYALRWRITIMRRPAQ
jgi:uncharacterized protein involved in exopolysaccharide biosynthesis